MSKSNLLAHLQQVARERNPDFHQGGHFYVREYIRQELGKFGNVQEHLFQINQRKSCNLILDICSEPDLRNKPPILIGAHYDGVINSVGADDNGTGVAVLLEMAKYFSEHGAKSPIRLVAFDLEEYGCLGSQAYAQELKELNLPLRLMFSLEMLGYCDRSPNSQSYPTPLQYLYPSVGDFIALIGNNKALFDLIRIHRSLKKYVKCQWLPAGKRGALVPDTRRSDHGPFWDYGYKAIMVTDTANLRNPHYHQPTDTIETIDLEFLTNVYQGLVNTISKL